MPAFQKKFLANLWLDSGDRKISAFLWAEEERIRVLKSVDWLNHKLTRCEGKEKYFYLLYKGVKKLLSHGHRHILWEHGPLMERLITSGLDLMKIGNSYVYTGALIDLKIRDNWDQIRFYNLILKLLKKIEANVSVLSKELKSKIRNLYLEKYPNQLELFGNAA